MIYNLLLVNDDGDVITQIPNDNSYICKEFKEKVQFKEKINRSFTSKSMEGVKLGNQNFFLFKDSSITNKIIYLLSDYSLSDKNKVWELMEDVSTAIKEQDIEKGDLVNNVKAIIEPHLKSDVYNKLDSTTIEIESRISSLKSDAINNLDKLRETFDMAQDSDKKASLLENDSKSVKNHYWWQNKKFLIAIAFSILAILFFIFLILKCSN